MVCVLYRLGGGKGDAEEVKSHPFFETINWDDLYNLKIPPPFVPVVKSEVSVEYFDKEFTDEPVDLTPPDDGMLCSPTASSVAHCVLRTQCVQQGMPRICPH